MTKLTIGVIAVAVLSGGCANVEPQERLWESPPPKEAYILGSKLQRSEYLENYQGVKAVGARDYQQYKKEPSSEPPMGPPGR